MFKLSEKQLKAKAIVLASESDSNVHSDEQRFVNINLLVLKLETLEGKVKQRAERSIRNLLEQIKSKRMSNDIKAALFDMPEFG